MQLMYIDVVVFYGSSPYSKFHFAKAEMRCGIEITKARSFSKTAAYRNRTKVILSNALSAKSVYLFTFNFCYRDLALKQIS